MLGLVHLMQMSDQPAAAAHAAQLVPSALLLFDGLKRAYAARSARFILIFFFLNFSKL